MEQKRIYSLNLVAYLLSKNIDYEAACRDEEGKAYFVFPEIPEVGTAINKYKLDDNLHCYLEQFKKVKEIIKDL